MEIARLSREAQKNILLQTENLNLRKSLNRMTELLRKNADELGNAVVSCCAKRTESASQNPPANPPPNPPPGQFPPEEFKEGEEDVVFEENSSYFTMQSQVLVRPPSSSASSQLPEQRLVDDLGMNSGD